MMRQIHLQLKNPSREESHQARVLSKDKVKKAHNREDHRNRVRAQLDRGQDQDKHPQDRDLGKVKDHQVRDPNQHRDLLGRDLGKARDSQAKGPNQVKVPLVKGQQARGPNQHRALLGRDPGKVRDHQVKALLSKTLHPLSKNQGGLYPNNRDHQGLI